MAHTERCGYSRSDRKKCKCKGCNGVRHGEKIEAKVDSLIGEKILSIADGGEIADFIRSVKGKDYYCTGSHNRENDAIELGAIEKANVFYGYPHSGGLADGTGAKWWVYVKCSNPRFPGSEYATSFAHLNNAIVMAEREKAYHNDWRNRV
ncbi:MAG: hypothetical protein QXL94_00195 [Candidatus Parvarchaeum sp.]